MSNHISKQHLLATLSILAPALLLGACLHRTAIDLPPLATSAPAGSSPAPIPWETAKTVLDNRCVVCHGCFDAPCQLLLSSAEGLDRGASQKPVYDGARLLPSDPSRLFFDAQTTEGWRDRGFFSVLEAPDSNSADLVKLMLELGAANPLPPGERVPPSVSLDIERELTCSTPKQFDSYIRKHPLGGMPYATAPLAPGELLILADWLETGAAHSPPAATLPASAQQQIVAWEGFLNGTSIKDKIVARYLYEHWFSAHLYFQDSPDGPFFRIVRSSTPPGTPIDIISTRRPYDDPGTSAFWYRLRPITSTIVHKTHTIYELGSEKMTRLRELFLESEWQASSLPSYSPDKASNPFITFADIPPRARYQYLLDDAQFFVMTFIRGPVCRGQIATNVIQDHFFTAFLDPDYDLSVRDPAFLAATEDDLNLPAEHLSRLVPGEFFIEYGKEQRDYLDARNQAYTQSYPDGLGLEAIWDGDGHNTNALLTIFRHWNNATVLRGWQGDWPKTAWVMDYPIFERIYYDLVAGFDVFGNAAHQAATRLYMDHLRMQSENNLLEFLPPAQRETTRASWYIGATRSLDYRRVDRLLNTQRPTQVIFDANSDAEAYVQLLGLVLEKNVSVAGKPDLLNRCQDTNCEMKTGSELQQNTERTLQRIASTQGAWVAILPEVSRLRVNSANESAVWTLVRNLDHDNVAFMFGEAKRLNPQGDTLTILRGYLGSYPNFAFDVDANELDEFVNRLMQASSEQDLQAIAARWGVRRTDPDFWPTMDWFVTDFYSQQPTAAGLFDLGRYENH
ncbi:MAG: fatty acid cis/trans isomerase [Myxococcota bacterium]|nr:fatty acid cis/trans isomerase [Myxococcota bacterium]